MKLEGLGEDIKLAAADARINLSPEEEKGLEKQLENILRQAAFLNESDIDEAEPTHYPYTQQITLREDIAAPSLPLDKVLENAPEANETYFLVPKIVE